MRLGFGTHFPCPSLLLMVPSYRVQQAPTQGRRGGLAAPPVVVDDGAGRYSRETQFSSSAWKWRIFVSP